MLACAALLAIWLPTNFAFSVLVPFSLTELAEARVLPVESSISWALKLVRLRKTASLGLEVLPFTIIRVFFFSLLLIILCSRLYSLALLHSDFFTLVTNSFTFVWLWRSNITNNCGELTDALSVDTRNSNDILLDFCFQSFRND